MRRFLLNVPILAVLLIGLFASPDLGVQSASQADVPATAGHPLVGTWLLDLGEEGGRLLTFSADGTAVFADADGTTGQGTWEATGDSTAVFTTYRLISDHSEEDSSFTGYSILSGEITVDGTETWTGDLVVAQTEHDGVIMFVNGPSTLSASRISVVPTDQLTIGVRVTGLPSTATPAP